MKEGIKGEKECARFDTFTITIVMNYHTNINKHQNHDHCYQLNHYFYLFIFMSVWPDCMGERSEIMDGWMDEWVDGWMSTFTCPFVLELDLCPLTTGRHFNFS